ncbi:transposase [Roseomonas sp. KE2513]|nr:transposase [Roseomonas sp. KE2513]
MDEVWLLPPSVQEFVPQGRPAHQVRDNVVEELDLFAILSAYTEPRGYSPYHPAMMVGLLLYAYRRGVYSSRRIARACEGSKHCFEPRLPGGDGAEPVGLPHHQRVPPASSGGAGRALRAGAHLVPTRRLGRARPCRAGRHQAAGQCLQAQGDELRPDGPGRNRAGGRG